MSQSAATALVGYFDSSALVKRYVAEAGTPWVQAWCENDAQTAAIAEIGLVEIAAAFAAKFRGGFITQTVYNDVRTDLETDAQNEYVLVTVERLIVNDAIELTTRHPLRGYDAVHLACALRLNQALRAQQLPPLHFICADNDLLAAAMAEGLTTKNPNEHS